MGKSKEEKQKEKEAKKAAKKEKKVLRACSLLITRQGNKDDEKVVEREAEETSNEVAPKEVKPLEERKAEPDPEAESRPKPSATKEAEGSGDTRARSCVPQGVWYPWVTAEEAPVSDSAEDGCSLSAYPLIAAGKKKKKKSKQEKKKENEAKKAQKQKEKVQSPLIRG